MFPFKLKFLALPLAWFLTLMILDGTDEKIVGNSSDLFLVYIQKFLPTLAWKCQMQRKKIFVGFDNFFMFSIQDKGRVF